MTIARACPGVGLVSGAGYRPRIDWAERGAPVVEALEPESAGSRRSAEGIGPPGYQLIDQSEEATKVSDRQAHVPLE